MPLGLVTLQMALGSKSSVRRAVDESIRLYSPSINIRYVLLIRILHLTV